MDCVNSMDCVNLTCQLMTNNKGLHFFLDTKKTKQINHLSHLTLDSPSHRLLSKDRTLKPIDPKNHKHQEICDAIETRFSRCRMNHEYHYNNRKDRESTHSSQMDEFKDLKELTHCNLVEENKRLKRKKERSKSRSSAKINNNLSSTSLVRKNESRQPSPVLKSIFRAGKYTREERSLSPLSMGVFKKQDIKNTKLGASDRRNGNVMTIQFPSKYDTLSPYSKNRKKRRQEFPKDDSFSQTHKSYSTLRLGSHKNKKVESSKLITEVSYYQGQRKSVQKRTRVYSSDKL